MEHRGLEHNRRFQRIRQVSPQCPREYPHLALAPLWVGFHICANTFFSPVEFKGSEGVILTLCSDGRPELADLKTQFILYQGELKHR